MSLEMCTWDFTQSSTLHLWREQADIELLHHIVSGLHGHLCTNSLSRAWRRRPVYSHKDYVSQKTRPALGFTLTPWPGDTCSIGGASPSKELQIDIASGWALQVRGHPLNPALAWLFLAWLYLGGVKLLVFLMLQENSTLAQIKPAKQRWSSTQDRAEITWGGKWPVGGPACDVLLSWLAVELRMNRNGRGTKGQPPGTVEGSKVYYWGG